MVKLNLSLVLGKLKIVMMRPRSIFLFFASFYIMTQVCIWLSYSLALMSVNVFVCVCVCECFFQKEAVLVQLKICNSSLPFSFGRFSLTPSKHSVSTKNLSTMAMLFMAWKRTFFPPSLLVKASRILIWQMTGLDLSILYRSCETLPDQQKNVDFSRTVFFFMIVIICFLWTSVLCAYTAPLTSVLTKTTETRKR